MAKKIEEISKFIQNMKFKRKIFGGIDEIDALKKIEKLNLEYKELYQIQQAKIDILEERINEGK